MFVFREIWRALFSWNTRFEIRPFDLLPTNSEIKFLRDQVASKHAYFHEKIKFLRQQFETALSKQENSNIGFCNNRHVQHIPSNIANSDDSFIMTDYHTKATGSDNNIQTDSYANKENTDNTIVPLST